jgi:hypothetical protein
MSNRWTSWAALLFVVFSAYCSLNFELAVAREQFAPVRRMPRSSSKIHVPSEF